MHVGPGECTNAMPNDLLNYFHLRCLRKLLTIRWQDKIPDTEVPGYRSPKESRDAKRVYYFEACAAEIDWPYHSDA